jgi:L-alanine-DL-glutamate epimerase-like enolase superfamily enzyme
VRITSVETHVLLDPGYEAEATSSAQDTIVVEVHTDEGIVGIGETDLNAWVARALIEAPGTHTMDRGLGASLVGMDPLDPVAVWETLYVGTAMTGRRGAGVHALGAIDIALWDICGKAKGVPCWRLLGERPHDALTPYASLLPQETDFDAFLGAMVSLVLESRRLGFGAAKLEIILDGPYASMGLRESDDRATEVIAAVRREVGPDFVLMVDVGYAWDSVDRAASVLATWEQYDLFFVETPLWTDDLDGYAELARRAPIRIAAGEWLSTRHEFEQLLDRGLVAVAQPDVGRVGGLTEARRVCELAADRGRLVVPHCWKTGISVAAAAHLAAVTPHCPYFEFLPGALAESALRRELVAEELRLVDGRLPLPERPGLGVELDRDALVRFESAARRLEQRMAGSAR